MSMRMLMFCAVPALLVGSADAPAGPAPDPREAAAATHAAAWVRMLEGELPAAGLREGHFSPRFQARMPVARAEMIFGVLRRFYGEGPVTVEETVAGDRAVTLTLRNSDGRRAEYELQFEPGDPTYRLGGFNARILGAAPEATWTGLTLDALIAKTERHADSLAAAGAFSGTVLIGHGAEVRLERSWGRNAPGAGSPPIRNDTPFPIASVSKVLNAVAVATLIRDGDLEPGAPIGRYLPDLPNPDLREHVTIEQLLMHSSGVADMMFADDHGHRPPPADLAELAAEVAGRPLAGPPGTAYRYGNGGAILLGRVVERLDGAPYPGAIARRVFTPAGMRHSGYLTRGHYPPTVARGAFTGPSGRTITTRDAFDTAPDPSAAVHASARDLFALQQALFRHGALSALLGILTAKHVEAGGGTDYTTGLMRRHLGKRTALGHMGSLPGVSAEWWYVPELEVGLVVLSNHGDAAAQVAERVLSGLATARMTDAPPR